MQRATLCCSTQSCSPAGAIDYLWDVCPPGCVNHKLYVCTLAVHTRGVVVEKQSIQYQWDCAQTQWGEKTGLFFLYASDPHLLFVFREKTHGSWFLRGVSVFAESFNSLSRMMKKLSIWSGTTSAGAVRQDFFFSFVITRRKTSTYRKSWITKDSNTALYPKNRSHCAAVAFSITTPPTAGHKSRNLEPGTSSVSDFLGDYVCYSITMC